MRLFEIADFNESDMSSLKVSVSYVECRKFRFQALFFSSVEAPLRPCYRNVTVISQVACEFLFVIISRELFPVVYL